MTSPHAAPPPCAVAGCEQAGDPTAPAPLCHGHLAAVAEWSGEANGVAEPLPSPCAACGSRLGVTYRSGRLCAVCEWRYGDSPDGELAPPRVDVVYYLRFRGSGGGAGAAVGARTSVGTGLSVGTGPTTGARSVRRAKAGAALAAPLDAPLDSPERIKIGTTANPRQRFGALRFDELLAFERGDRAVEQARHRQFAQDRLGGEWFAASSALEDHIAAIAAGHPDPWALYARWRSEALALRVL